jgi:hypothetical protein
MGRHKYPKAKRRLSTPCAVSPNPASGRSLNYCPPAFPRIPGTYAEAFTEGGAQVSVFDLPEVIQLMKERLAAADISAVGGDFNESLPEGPFDAAYLGSVSHTYGPEEN